MIPGMFYNLVPNPHGGDTVTAKVVDRMEYFLNNWRYFRKHIKIQSLCTYRSKLC